MKIAVVFPGIGYHADKPLLYYSKKTAKCLGYEILEVQYGDFPSGVKGDRKKMQTCFLAALAQTEEILKGVDFTSCEEILFISKSIGTTVAAAYAQTHHLKTGNLYFTPIADSFQFMKNRSGIVFHGTADPWIETKVLLDACEKKDLPVFVTENANHSLETGDVKTDLRNLQLIMDKTEEYIGNGRTFR
ncbi:MAG: alpha/beta hydrolase [Clostridiales bacterium]|nr:alpha/beta hydrolase [Clostridiales bacterium]